VARASEIKLLRLALDHQEMLAPLVPTVTRAMLTPLVPTVTRAIAKKAPSKKLLISDQR
jgi:hypothetical protein